MLKILSKSDENWQSYFVHNPIIQNLPKILNSDPPGDHLKPPKTQQNSIGIVEYCQKSYSENLIKIGWKLTEIFCLQANHPKFAKNSKFGTREIP